MPPSWVSVLHPAGVHFPVLPGSMRLYLLHRRLLPCSRGVANCLCKISVPGCSGVCSDAIATQTSLGSAKREPVGVQLKTHSRSAAWFQVHGGHCSHVPSMPRAAPGSGRRVARGDEGPALLPTSWRRGSAWLLGPMGTPWVMLWQLEPVLEPGWLRWSQLAPGPGGSWAVQGSPPHGLQSPAPRSHGVSGSHVPRRRGNPAEELPLMVFILL